MKKSLLPLALFLFGTYTVAAQPERLYGLTASGGNFNQGTIFRIKTDNTGFTGAHHFAGGATDGSNPSGPMAEADGKLYGTAPGGGAFGQGVLFEFDPGTNGYALKHSFFGFDGAGPKGGLTEAGGSLWGVTELGGSNGAGVLFDYKPMFDDFQVYYEFDLGADGGNPTGNLLVIGNKIYGTTRSGGDYGYGTLFDFDISTNTFTVLHHFDSFYGEMPLGGLVEKDGLLYGLCSGGGNYGAGVLFAYHLMYSFYQDLHHFDGANDGGNPEGDLLVSGDKLYGLAPVGGAFSEGVLFEYDLLTSSYGVLFDFFGPLGASPKGSLLEVDGKLYGFTQAGGATDEGVIFEFDPAINIIALFQDLGGVNGAQPGYGRFSLAPPCQAYGLDAYALAPACQTPASGTIKVIQAYGGAQPFQFTINGGGSYQSSALFLNLTPGSYTLEAKDDNDCPSDPLPLTVNPLPPDATPPSLACRDVTLTIPPDCSPVTLELADVLDPAAPVFYLDGQNLGNNNSTAVALGDLDGDSDLDAFVVNRIYQPNEVWLNLGAGLFSNTGQSLPDVGEESWARDVALGDLDGDGDLDAFVANGEGSRPNHVWLNNGAGLFTDSGQRLGDARSGAVALGDVDGDGDLDACIVNNGGGDVNELWLNDGAGTFTNSGQNLGAFSSEGLALGDVDGDGDLDLFFANSNAQPDRVYLNNGSGVFTDSGQLLGSSEGYDADLGDLDGDGDLDAFVTNFVQPNTVWLNNGAGVFSPTGQAFGDGAQVRAALGDLDNDGDLDAFVAKTSPSNTAAVWLNDGTGLFNFSGQTLTNSFHFNVALGDVDNDGDLDAMLAALGSNTLWINALGEGRSDGCTALGSLSTNLSQTVFNASHAGANMVTLTVTDAASNSASCTVTVTVVDCTIKFSGSINWEHDNSGVKDASVNLSGSATGSSLSDINGDFSIPTSLTSGSFTLKPVKNLNKLNGVTAGDATAIQQHVTFINPIVDPYKLVCADVNKSNSVTTFDASLIQQCLLGNPQANAIFNTSWRFVPTSHTMTMPPWGFPEQRTYTGISASQSNQDFIGMKLGDVTGDANPANFGGGKALRLIAQDQFLNTDADYSIDLMAGQLDDLVAFQFALYLDPAYLEIVAVEPLPGGLPLTIDNIGLYKQTDGEIRVVVAKTTGFPVAEATPALRLRIKARQDGLRLSEALRLDNSILPGFSYDSALEESEVALSFLETTGVEPGDPGAVANLQLQNRPNPFNQTTTISFVLPEAAEAQLRIFDASGRLLWERNMAYPAGYNEEVVQLLDGVFGVLSYELVTPFGAVTKPMVRVGN
ncbi:MAG: VCBS repeat-containing protein [Lewinellaceae bacterium]|nr:VCBS repeat-containing protein [Lewinellaceae bacterium]